MCTHKRVKEQQGISTSVEEVSDQTAESEEEKHCQPPTYLEIVESVIEARTDQLLRDEYEKIFARLADNPEISPVPLPSEEAYEEARHQTLRDFSGRLQWCGEFGSNASPPENAAETIGYAQKTVSSVAKRFENEDIRLKTAEAALKIMTIEDMKEMILDTAECAQAGSEFLKILCSQASEYWRRNRYAH